MGYMAVLTTTNARLPPASASYFKNRLEYHIFEYYEECGRAWAQEFKPEAALYFGDQANVTHLQVSLFFLFHHHLRHVFQHPLHLLADLKVLDKAMLDKLPGPIDILIDDGGHEMNQQITSFNYLFPHMRVGGLYFLEDLETSYMRTFSLHLLHLLLPLLLFLTPSQLLHILTVKYGGVYKGKNTTVEYIKGLLDNLNGHGPEGPVSDLIASIDCQRELCVFVRGENRPKSWRQ